MQMLPTGILHDPNVCGWVVMVVVVGGAGVYQITPHRTGRVCVCTRARLGRAASGTTNLT